MNLQKLKSHPNCYYHTDNGVLLCGDCVEILPDIEQVGLILTDPPYGISHPTDYKNRGRGKLAVCNNYAPVYNDQKPFDPSLLLALSVPTVLWGANYFTEKLPISSGWLVWDKLRPDNLDQATCELAWTNCVKGVRRFKHLWHGMTRQSEHGKNYHPTQKPIVLMMWVLGLRWIPAGMVLDPYCGSASVLIACERLNRSWVGIEILESYCHIAKERIKNEIAQLKMF